MKEKKEVCRKYIQKIIIPASIGNAIELYDFVLYAFLAPVIATTFFPSDNRLTSLLSTFSVFALSFFMRPLGALLFGFLGDKKGRRKVYSYTVFLMAIPTIGIAVTPSYEALGVLSPVLLVFFRLLQGLCIGGEYNGAAIYAVENAPTGRKGFAGGLITASSTLGLVVGSGVVTIIKMAMMPTWAWRVAYALGGLVGLVGFYVRKKSPEDQSILEELQKRSTQKVFFKDLITTYRRPFFCTIGVACFSAIVFYSVAPFISVYLREFKNWPPELAMQTTTAGLFVYLFVATLSGHAVDRFGPRKILSIGALGTLLMIYPIFYIFEKSTAFWVVLCAQVMGQTLAGLFQGAMNYFMAFLFPVHIRYRGVALGYTIGMAIFGGTALNIMTYLAGEKGDLFYPALYIMFGSLVGLAAALLSNTQKGVKHR